MPAAVGKIEQAQGRELSAPCIWQGAADLCIPEPEARKLLHALVIRPPF